MARTFFKWLIVLLGLLFLLASGYLLYGARVKNPEVIAAIRASTDAVLSRRVMVLSLPDGRDLPVNYLQEENRVFIGVDGPWWRQFVDAGAAVRVNLRGADRAGHARAVLDDPDYRDEVFARLRPTVPAWLPDWANGKLVVIELDP